MYTMLLILSELRPPPASCWTINLLRKLLTSIIQNNFRVIGTQNFSRDQSLRRPQTAKMYNRRYNDYNYGQHLYKLIVEFFINAFIGFDWKWKTPPIHHTLQANGTILPNFQIVQNCKLRTLPIQTKSILRYLWTLFCRSSPIEDILVRITKFNNEKIECWKSFMILSHLHSRSHWRIRRTW